ncbi:cbb3-type cytochrome oxidase assembly protein CcoS [Uliginosibacterium sp. sgz301328]|uniref:cbb3-type cytochrome oxidase assembly protein CcoS n=1 Tax=Uliginosibacterium sp. sgz301328 TaxID=3243764 RepID=UPI00359DC549
MESSLYILVPLSIVLVFIIAGIFWWSVRSGQFDDLEGPAWKVLLDDERPMPDTDEIEQGEDKRKN